MPELPDVTVYVERLRAFTLGHVLLGTRLTSPFVLRTVSPPLTETHGKPVVAISRLGKRIVFDFDDELYVVMHLMIAGRLRWKSRGVKIPGKVGLAAFDFEHGSLLFTEASPKKRASLHVVRGRAELAEFDRGGLEILEATAEMFREAMRAENHTLKRALTDPRIISGVGNAYSDEILHRAKLSPFKQTRSMSDEELDHLHASAVQVLTQWVERLRAEVGDDFPDKVTAFHEQMAVHGRHRLPCPECGAPVQRIRYADNEANYCAKCQTGGRVLADRALSRLLKENWPRTLEELEAVRSRKLVEKTVPDTSDGGSDQ